MFSFLGKDYSDHVFVLSGKLIAPEEIFQQSFVMTRDSRSGRISTLLVRFDFKLTLWYLLAVRITSI